MRSAVVMVMTMCLAWTPSTSAHVLRPKAADHICSTTACTRAAASLSALMNVSADPCSDFYAFACGSGRVQGFNNQDDPQTAKRDVVKKQLITILSEPVTNETVLAYTKAKKLYKSCADTKHREQLGVEPAKKLLTSIGGWPLIDGVNACNSSRKCDLSELVVKVIDVGLISNHLVDVTVLPGISGSNKWTLHASRPSFNVGTPLAELLKNTFIPDYREKLKASAELLADNQKPISRTLDYEVAQIVDFEVTLNNISKNENPSKNFTVSELLSRFSFLPWMAIYNRYLLKGLSDYDVVTVDDPNYLDDVKEILKSTPNRTVINYVVGRSVLEGMLPFLNSEARILAEPYGLKNKSIEERCLGFVHESFPLLTTSMYVRQHIRKEVRDKVVEVVVNIIAEMKHILQNEAWLDEGSRRAFNTKLEKMTYIVGYPDELLNTALLNSHFGNVQISDDSLLENSISISKRMYSRMFAKFNTSVEKLDWDFPITWAPFEPESLLNAQYIHVTNSLILFPGFLSDLSEPGRLDGLTYGLLGSLIGHEISHAFDSEGISRNGDGIVEKQWRDDVTKKVFDRQVRRIEEHYGNLTLEGAFAKVNGTTTRNENMADITGELLAYRAYLRLREKVGGEEPGLQIPPQTGNRVQGPVLSARQLFWVSYASCYCSAYSPEMIDAELLLDRDDAHLPNYYRVTGSLMNLKEFAAAFSCPSGSYMNPTQKILVWGSGTNDVQGD